MPLVSRRATRLTMFAPRSPEFGIADPTVRGVVDLVLLAPYSPPIGRDMTDAGSTETSVVIDAPIAASYEVEAMVA